VRARPLAVLHVVVVGLPPVVSADVTVRTAHLRTADDVSASTAIVMLADAVVRSKMLTRNAWEPAL